MIEINESRILILDILDLLKRHSDKNHPLSQKSIIDILGSDYGHKNIRRQTVKTYIERMINHYELGDPKAKEDDPITKLSDPIIKLAAEDNYHLKEAKDLDDKERRITNVYYQHKFSEPELLLIIDSILFSKQIGVEERKSLIEKLKDLSSKHFKSRIGNISAMSDTNKLSKGLQAKTVFDNIKEIDEAISQSKKISFNYKTYAIRGNKISLEIKNIEGKEREYIINPYHMAASTGRYYLICNNDKFNNVSSYRIDRMVNVKILDKKRKPLEDVEGLGRNFTLNDYMKENIYMFGGESGYVKLRLKKEFLNEFIDWFGPEDITVQELEEDHIIVRVKSNLMAMRKWALRYALYVKVLSPIELVEDIKEDIKKIMENYS